MADGTCNVEGCTRTGEMVRGWRAGHYRRWRLTGDVRADIPLRSRTTAETCAAPDCPDAPFRREWCSKHYQRVMRLGTVDLPAKPDRRCAVPDCENPWRSGDYCAMHWFRWKKYGDPHTLKRQRNNNPPATCTEPGCGAPHYARGHCRRHNAAARYTANRDSILERNRAHYLSNREMYFAVAARRRQRVRADLDAVDRMLSVSYRKAIAGDRCRYCGAPGETVDHFFPLAKGGTDVWWNLRPACGPCNSSKAAHCGTWFRLLPDIGSVARSGTFGLLSA